MRVEQFIEFYRPDLSEYCPVIIWPDGNIFESSAGHLQMLRSLSSEAQLNSIPSDVSPMMYLAGLHRAVIVDYENQVYLEELTSEQEHALAELANAQLIKEHRIKMSHESTKI